MSVQVSENNTAQKRTQSFVIRFTKRELERIKSLTEKSGASSISEYIRDKALGRRRYKKKVSS